MSYSIPEDVAARVRRLPPPQQEQALAYVRQLESVAEQRQGPAALARFAGTIAPADLAVMAAAIEADCERVDATSW